VGGFRVRLHLYTVPGQVLYDTSRQLILKGVDGLVFVADSHPLRVDANAEAWDGLQRNLAHYNRSLAGVPTVVEYNKRDLPDALPVAELRQGLGNPGLPEFESVAVEGVGVFEALRSVARDVMRNLQPHPPAPRPPTPDP